jgi:hypothetical protein
MEFVRPETRATGYKRRPLGFRGHRIGEGCRVECWSGYLARELFDGFSQFFKHEFQLFYPR